jgi:hypothetical protein
MIVADNDIGRVEQVRNLTMLDFIELYKLKIDTIKQQLSKK